MGDYTYYSLDLPADLPPAVLATAAGILTEDEWTPQSLAAALPGMRHGADRIRIDVEERPLGAAGQIAGQVLALLTEHGLDVAFTVTEDPRYQWLGTLVRYRPGLGLHTADCGFDGEAVLSDRQYQALRGEPDPAARLAAIESVLGTEWDTPPAPATVVPAPAVYRCLDTSTDHLSADTMRRITGHDPDLPVLAVYDDGAILHVDPTTDTTGPEDLRALLSYAASRDCYLLRLDTDSAPIPGLPLHPQ